MLLWPWNIWDMNDGQVNADLFAAVILFNFVVQMALVCKSDQLYLTWKDR